MSAIVARFIEAPAIGTELIYQDQSFRLAKVEPYERQDGGQSNLLTWVSSCPECGVDFDMQSGRSVLIKYRRCPEHRKGGPIRRRGKRVPNAVIPN